MALSKVNTDSLVSVADAIRAKGGTSAPLSFPFGFVSAINDIETGGGGGTDIEDSIIERTISEYTNSRVTTVGPFAFYSHSVLTTVNFLNANYIASSAFRDCHNLTTVSFPNVNRLGSNCFCFCSKLTTVDFPNVTSIGDSAFANCYSLTAISFPLAETVRNNAFTNCRNLTTVSFPLVTSVAAYAFASCYSLATASFSKATSLPNNTFVYCSRLLSLYLLGSTKASIQSATFSSTPIAGYTTYTDGVYGSVFVPASLYDAYCSAQYWSSISARIVSLTDAEIAALE